MDEIDVNKIIKPASKNEKSNHGIGISSVKEAVARYERNIRVQQGWYRIRCRGCV